MIVRSHRMSVQQSLKRHGLIPILIQKLNLSTMLEFWKIQPVDGQPGMLLKQAINLDRVYTKRYRKGHGLHLFGTYHKKVI